MYKNVCELIYKIKCKNVGIMYKDSKKKKNALALDIKLQAQILICMIKSFKDSKFLDRQAPCR